MAGVVKYAGKIYIDRYKGRGIDQDLIVKAVGIIKAKASESPETVVLTASKSKPCGETSKKIPACLAAVSMMGKVVVKSAILNILSMGRTGQYLYYVTAGERTEKHNRFWVRAFECSSPDQARQVCKTIIKGCEGVQSGWTVTRDSQSSHAMSNSTKEQNQISSSASRGIVKSVAKRLPLGVVTNKKQLSSA
eukprot:m.349226 g.349226  ORF g.349226 m.349226 type:complete len:192 (-) comp40919_c0_seq1:42-617(-)